MDCRSCGVDLPRDAAYCLRCGAQVELGSVLGVGTDLPPMPPRAGEQDLVATGFAQSAQRTPPIRPSDVDATSGFGPSRSTILAMVATFVVLTIIGTFALTRILGPDAPETVATLATPVTPTTSTEEGEAPPSESPTTPSASPSNPPTPSPTATPLEPGVAIPAGARRCSTNGNDAVSTTYAATERTSCEFAGAVREAYRKAGTPDGATTLRAFSPVTEKWYSLSCDGGAPVRCTSTTNAVVLLVP